VTLPPVPKANVSKANVSKANVSKANVSKANVSKATWSSPKSVSQSTGEKQANSGNDLSYSESSQVETLSSSSSLGHVTVYFDS
jgi:uncharacterized protein YjbI with pentapeptide repeats